MMRILLFLLLYGQDSLNTAQITQLGLLANNCPLIAGNAVYKARMMYAMFVPSVFFDNLEICNELGLYKTTHDSTDYQKEQALLNEDSKEAYVEILGNEKIKVFPNPAIDQITIQYKIPENSIAQFKIVDMLGNEFYTILLNGAVSRVTTKLPNISKGVYIYQFIENGNITYTGKLVIK